MHARVLLCEPVGLLDYRIPVALAAELNPGVPVRVPLGKRTTHGWVAALVEAPPPAGVTLKEIVARDDQRPRLPAALVELVLFAADYYLVSPGEMMTTALPPLVRPGAARFRLAEGAAARLGRETAAPNERALLSLAERHPRGFGQVAMARALAVGRSHAATLTRRWLKEGVLVRSARATTPRAAIAFERVADATATLGPRQRGAAELFATLPPEEAVPAAVIAARDRNAYAHLRTLVRLGLVRRVTVAHEARPADEVIVPDTPPTPTPAQAAAIDAATRALEAGRFQTFLLQGVTGSGKTEVYLRLIARALELERTALVLVPEIALTPQLSARFRARFGDRVVTFHSSLSPAERRDGWERVASGEAPIAVGARSAVFLPLERLGVVIVDEEYETSYKQEESPRYHARDLAVVRGQKENAVVVLGSATPALETRANADAGRYLRLDLPARIHDRPLPEVARVALADAERVGTGVFTRPLAVALEATLAAGEQAVLFLNRRGFAPYVFCRDCGHAFRCPDCAVALTLHRRRGLLLCHYCGFEEPAPETCPKCLGRRVESFGLGTERIESEIGELFGDVRIARLDRDTVRRRADLDRQLSRFARGEARILVGTQMVAKGHDFPAVTLVGVVAADASLNFPDFRAAERTFQLLTQVAGRAGRGDRPGRVIVQAYETEHYAVAAAAAHDYETFAAQELATRRELDYPPYSHLALIRFESPIEAAALAEAKEAAARLRFAARAQEIRVKVLGPAPAPLTRLRGAWRMQVLIKGKTRRDVRGALAALGHKPARNVRQILDVDPFSML